MGDPPPERQSSRFSSVRAGTSSSSPSEPRASRRWRSSSPSPPRSSGGRPSTCGPRAVLGEPCRVAVAHGRGTTARAGASSRGGASPAADGAAAARRLDGSSRGQSSRAPHVERAPAGEVTVGRSVAARAPEPEPRADPADTPRRVRPAERRPRTEQAAGASPATASHALDGRACPGRAVRGEPDACRARQRQRPRGRRASRSSRASASSPAGPWQGSTAMTRRRSWSPSSLPASRPMASRPGTCGSSSTPRTARPGSSPRSSRRCLRQRNPEARARAIEDLSELAELGEALMRCFSQATLRELTGG